MKFLGGKFRFARAEKFLAHKDKYMWPEDLAGLLVVQPSKVDVADQREKVDALQFDDTEFHCHLLDLRDALKENESTFRFTTETPERNFTYKYYVIAVCWIAC